MILDNDKIVKSKTVYIPLTPKLMKDFGYEEKRSPFGYITNTIFQDPYRCYIKFKEIDRVYTTDSQLFKSLQSKGQRYCYIVRLELYTIGSFPVYTLYTVQDLKNSKKY